MPSSPEYSAPKEARERERKRLDAEAKAKGDQDDLRLLLLAFLIIIVMICIVGLLTVFDARILWLLPLLPLWFCLELAAHGFAGWIRAYRKRKR